MSPQAGLLQTGLDALEQHRYADAVHFLEQACQAGTDVDSKDHLRSQISLARAYQRNGQIEQATALCQKLANHANPQVKTWAEQALRSLSKPTGQASPSQQQLDEWCKSGRDALKQKHYAEAIQPLEAYCSKADPAGQDYTQAQIWLAKAYKGNQQSEQAIALGQQLLTSNDAMVQTWAQQFVGSLAAAAVLQTVVPASVRQSLTGNASAAATPAADETPAASQLKSVSELQQFYQQHLLADLRHIEKMRKTVVRRVKAISLGLLLAPAIAAVVLFIVGVNPLWLLIGFVLLLTVWVALYSTITGEYALVFKARKIVEKIVTGIDPNLTYCAFGSKYSSRSAFLESQLFKHLATPDRFVEDDCVIGQIGETRIAFSEVCAQHEHYQSEDSDNRIRCLMAFYHVGSRLLKGQRISFSDFWEEVFDNVSRSPIFKGIFFTANFNKEFQFKTFIFPDAAESLIGGLANTFQSMNKRHGQLVKLEDPEFERLFAVYSEDQVEARYILSTNLMNRLVQFKEKSKRDISIAFVNNTIYVAIAYDEDLFEPKLYTSMLNFQPIQEYFENLQLVIGIVEDLKLNRRIWGK
jgi:tetratricopeptide (TPR) repeat protein